MQWEYSYFFPAITHCNHVTDWSDVGIIMDEEAVYSGDFLMKAGLNPIVNLRRRSVILEFQAVD